MATHQCQKCLRRTNENGEIAEPLVLATSECAAPGGGAHTWVPLGNIFDRKYFPSIANSSLIFHAVTHFLSQEMQVILHFL
jgi:hypothetical protein